MTTVRQATVSDLADVVGIYNEQVLHGLSTFDVEPVGVNHFTHRLSASGRGDEFLVAVGEDGTLLGFAYSGDFRPRAAYAGTRETSVYVAPAAARQGVGRALMTELLRRLDAVGIHTQVAVIAQPNEGSEALHASLGYEHIGTLRQVGRKFDRYVDTGWWQRLSPHH